MRDAGRTRRPSNWRRGGIGEYLVGPTLHENLTSGELILSDRGIPGSSGNVDHVVVASSGAWIIDAKSWSGTIEYRAKDFLAVKARLYVGGVDHTDHVERIYEAVIPIADVIADPSVRIHPALALAEGDWSLRSALRILRGKAFRHDRVWIGPPGVIAKLIRELETLSPGQILELSSLLNQTLPPR